MSLSRFTPIERHAAAERARLENPEAKSIVIPGTNAVHSSGLSSIGFRSRLSLNGCIHYSNWTAIEDNRGTDRVD
jgi:hypothetical protein